MKDIAITPYEQLTPRELSFLIESTHSAVKNEHVRQMLSARFMGGVIRRYADVYCNRETSRRLYAGLDKLRDPSFPDRGFVIFSSDSNEFLGLGSLQPNLELWKQRFPMPANFARTLTAQGIPVNTPIDVNSKSNIAAWVKTPNLKLASEQLTEAYSKIAAEAENGVWTLNPDIASIKYVYDALNQAHFYQRTSLAVARYDDLEARGSQWAPMSHLFFEDSVKPIPYV